MNSFNESIRIGKNIDLLPLKGQQVYIFLP